MRLPRKVSPGDVAPFGGRAPAHLLAERRALQAPGFEPLVALLERANIGLELLDVRAACQRLGIVARELLTPALEIGHDAVGLARRAGGLVARLFQGVAQHDEIALARQDLFLQPAHLRAQPIRLLEAHYPALRADNGVEKDHGAKTATDAVEEREGEYFSGTASRHG